MSRWFADLGAGGPWRRSCHRVGWRWAWPGRLLIQDPPWCGSGLYWVRFPSARSVWPIFPLGSSAPGRVFLAVTFRAVIFRVIAVTFGLRPLSLFRRLLFRFQWVFLCLYHVLYLYLFPSLSPFPFPFLYPFLFLFQLFFRLALFR